MTAVQSAFASPVVLTRAADLPVLPTAEFPLTRTLARRVGEGARPPTYCISRPGATPKDQVVLTAALIEPGGLQLLRGAASRSHPVFAITKDQPQFQAYEREIHEQYGLAFPGHPWSSRCASRARTSAAWTTTISIRSTARRCAGWTSARSTPA